MSKAFGSLFGSSQPQVTTGPSQFAQLPGFAQKGFEDVVSRSQAVSQTPEVFAPTPLPQDILTALAGLRRPLQPLTQQGFQDTLSIFQNPFEEQVVGGAMRDLQRGAADVQSNIGQQASAAGGFGGTRQALLESELSRNLLENIGNISGQIRQRGFETAADRAMSQINRQQDMQRQQLLDLITGGGIQQRQAMGERQAPLEAIRFLSEGLRGLPGGTGATSFSQNNGMLGQIGQAAGGLGTLGGLLSGVGSIFSDLRLKQNIRQISNKNGINLYEYNYQGSNLKNIGVIAQEIEADYPDAVMVDRFSGYKMVNYHKLPL